MAIDIQFRQIPMTAVAVEQYRPAMDSVWLVCGCIGLARLRRRTLVIRESIRKSMDGWRRDIPTVMRVPTWTESIASAKLSMKELLYNFGVANVLVL